MRFSVSLLLLVLLFSMGSAYPSTSDRYIVQLQQVADLGDELRPIDFTTKRRTAQMRNCFLSPIQCLLPVDNQKFNKFHKRFFNRANLYHFTTIYSEAAFEWAFSIYRPGTNAFLQSDVEVTSRNGRGLINPLECLCLFTVTNNNQIVSQIEIPGADASFQNVKFAISERNSFTDSLKSLIGSRVQPKCLQITVNLTLPRKFFEASKWRSSIPPTPLQLDDELFESFTDKSQHDLKVVCSDGEYLTNKAALWRSAPGLRKILEENTKTLSLDLSVQALKTTTVFMYTRTFSAPSQLDRNTLLEMHNWSKACCIQEQKSFMSAIEIFVCPQIQKLDLESICELLLLAKKCGWNQIEMSCNAILLRHHYVDLKSKYSPKINNNLAHRLRTKTTIGLSALDHLRKMWSTQEDVTLFLHAEAR